MGDQDMTAGFAEQLESTAEPGQLGTVTLSIHGGGAHGYDGTFPEGFEGVDTHVLDALPRARLTEEERLARDCTRRRTMEMERRQRIFDAKRRTIGLDKETLDQQCVENAQRRAAEEAQRRKEGKEHLQCMQQLALMEKDKKVQQRIMEKECKDISLQTLSFSQRREYDLNDPKAKSKALPMRIGDSDPRCGPASMLQFNGEDLLREERERQQKLATVDFIEQQKFEKEMLKCQNAGEDRIYAQQTAEITSLRNEVEEHEVALRRELMAENQNELLGRIANNQAQKAAQAKMARDLEAKELENHANDPFLNENHPRYHEGGRINPQGFKGTTKDEKIEVREMQRAQAEEKMFSKAYEGATSHVFDKHAEMSRKQLVLIEREKTRMKRAIAADNARQNKMLAQQQKDSLQATKDKNGFGPEFFEQFGTSTR